MSALTPPQRATVGPVTERLNELRLQEVLPESLPDAFAGISIEDRAVTIRTTGDEASVRSRTAELERVADVNVLKVNHSLRTLDALVQRISEDSNGFRDLRLAHVRVDVPNNRVDLGVSGGSPEEHRDLEVRYGGPGVVKVVESFTAWRPAADRVTDQQPWWGGSRIRVVGDGGAGGFCSLGFPLRKRNVNDGRWYRFAATAGHCWQLPSFGPQRVLQAGVFLGPATAFRYYQNSSGDSALIESDTQPKIWVTGSGPYPSNFVTASQFADSVGDRICGSGGYSGERCGATVQQMGGCYAYDDGPTVCALNRAFGSYLMDGDSGGPVYNYGGDGFINARGVVAAIGFDTRTGQATGDFLYTPIRTVNREFSTETLTYYNYPETCCGTRDYSKPGS